MLFLTSRAIIVAVALLVLPSAAHARTLIGTANADRLIGSAGNDRLDGRGGADRLDGRAGDDRILADDADRVRAGAGADRVTVRAASNRLDVDCGGGRDTLTIVTASGASRAALRRGVRRCERVTIRRSARRSSQGPKTPADGPPPPASGSSPAAPPPSGPTAAPTLFVAPGGSDAGSCRVPAEPCRSLSAAYRAARGGEVVQLAGGAYPSQILAHDPSKTSPDDVVFAPAPGAAVRVGGIKFGQWTLDLGARHVTLRDITIEGFSTQRTEDLTFENVTIAGAFFLQGAKDVTIHGGSAGGTEGLHSDIVDWYAESAGVVAPERITIDGVRFHDMVMATPSDHVECLQISGGTDIVLRNSRFERCDTFDVLAGDNRSRLSNLTIENNVFEPSTARFGNSYYGLSVRSGTNVVIRNNSSTQAWAGPSAGDRVAGWIVEGNVLPGGRCDGRITYRGNLWTGAGAGRCHDSDRLG